MGLFGSPEEMALVAAAVGWPLLAGLAVVAWSKRRAALAARREGDLDARLKGLYRTVESREPPERLALVIDTLAEQAEVEALAAREAAARQPGRRRARRKAAQE